MKYIAHKDREREQTIKEHLIGTATLAGQFAEKFGSKDWGYCGGMLHDIGKYVNLRDHHKNSYDLIINSSIFGLSDEDKKKIAILSYFHSKKEPSIDHRFFNNYSDSEKIKIIKLIAILKVADSLDRSHKQQVKDIIIKIDNSNMVLELSIADEPLIEKWAFEKKSELFS